MDSCGDSGKNRRTTSLGCVYTSASTLVSWVHESERARDSEVKKENE